ncbi:hypothetical protein [Dyella subtropica]|uniref:hypothetical protein n=1 Tax=Dyella subtropica TaxID=2992127 RepID=UPI00225055DE|nr:hypothetical protein [Dyella subtropica]
MELLLEVKDTFEIAGRGLALAPDLLLHGRTKDSIHDVLVERPDGLSIQAQARLTVEHFRPGGYKLVVYLPELRKEQVPIGTRVLWQPGQ